jgi:hypothetical protein
MSFSPVLGAALLIVAVLAVFSIDRPTRTLEIAPLTTESCTSTIRTVTLTSGQVPPPLAPPLPGYCYAFETLSNSLSSFTSSSSTSSSYASTQACTSTIVVTITSGQPPPPLAPPALGYCYAFVTVGQRTSQQTTATTTQPQNPVLCPIGWGSEKNGNCVPSNPILDAWNRLWNWLRCLLGYC